MTCLFHRVEAPTFAVSIDRRNFRERTALIAQLATEPNVTGLDRGEEESRRDRRRTADDDVGHGRELGGVMAGDDKVTLKGLAVAIVALSRFLADTDPGLGAFLKSSLASAQAAGIDAADLELLRTIVNSVSVLSS